MGQALSFFCVWLLSAFHPADRYTPWGFGQDLREDRFYEDWYGGQLRAMGEPILSRPGVRQGFVRRFRMLVLPSFDHPYAIRVDQSRDGRGAVRIVRMSGAGGYSPGHIAEQESFPLSAEAMAALNRDVAASGLDGHAPTDFVNDCLDGVGFVFELTDARRSWFVSIDGCGLSARLEALVWRIDALRRTVGSDLAGYHTHGGHLRVRD